MNTRRRYNRVDKPPYTYVAMTALAIQSFPGQSCRLGEIVEIIGQMFPVMRDGVNIEWKDSIRHTLSKFGCFFIDPSQKNLTKSSIHKGNSL